MCQYVGKQGALGISLLMLTGLVFVNRGAQPAAEASQAENAKVVAKEVSYYPEKENVKGYLARPDDDKKHPGIILIHEWWGLNDYIRANARRFAELGYVALAVDLYEGESTEKAEDARRLAGTVRSDPEKAFANLKAAVAYLKGHTEMVDPKRIASIGWCFGGGWSYEMAKNNLGVKASIIYYGRFNPKDDLKKMRATILGHFGKEDRSIRVDTVEEFQAKLKTLSGDHEIYIYENAGHAFANETGSRYNKEAADLAWKRTVRFLEKFLQPATFTGR